MKELKLIKSAKFGDIQADIYQKGKEPYMTINQLAECLGYRDRKSIEKIIERNSYLKNKEFSVTDKMSATDGKKYDTRVFTEDGIYEITMLAKTEKAKEFRMWIRTILKSLRKGETKLVGMTDYQRMMAQTRSDYKLEQKKTLISLPTKADIRAKQKIRVYLILTFYHMHSEISSVNNL